MGTGQGALRARYRNLISDFFLTLVLWRHWLFYCHLMASALIPGLAIYMIRQGWPYYAGILLASFLTSWFLVGCAWLLLRLAARPSLIQSGYRKVGATLAPQLRERFSTRLEGEHSEPMSILEVAQTISELIAISGTRALAKEACRSRRAAVQREAVGLQDAITTDA